MSVSRRHQIVQGSGSCAKFSGPNKVFAHPIPFVHGVGVGHRDENGDVIRVQSILAYKRFFFVNLLAPTA